MSKVSVITGIRIEIEPHPSVIRWAQTEEKRKSALEAWARDFEAFVRDHRSQDPVSLEVIADREDQCSHCGRAWEEDADGPLCCNEAQKDWDAAKEQAA